LIHRLTLFGAVTTHYQSEGNYSWEQDFFHVAVV
jgi:hypothetical protein